MFLNKNQCAMCEKQCTKFCKPDWTITKIGTVFDHTLEVLKNLKSNDFSVQIAALFHDVGKDEHCQQFIDGKIRFIDHEIYGAYKARKILKELKIDSQTIDDICFLIRHHMDVHRLEGVSKKTYRKFAREVPNDLVDKLFDLVDADGLGTLYVDQNGNVNGIPARDEQRALVHQTIEELKTLNEKPFKYFNGNQLMEFLNIQSGKLVGKAVSIMLDLQDEYGHDADPEFIKRLIIERFNSDDGE